MAPSSERDIVNSEPASMRRMSHDHRSEAKLDIQSYGAQHQQPKIYEGIEDGNLVREKYYQLWNCVQATHIS